MGLPAGTTVGERSLRPGRTCRGLGRRRGGRAGVGVVVGRRMEGSMDDGLRVVAVSELGGRGDIHGAIG